MTQAKVVGFLSVPDEDGKTNLVLVYGRANGTCFSYHEDGAEVEITSQAAARSKQNLARLQRGRNALSGFGLK